jgi:hypothetical protein
MSYTNRNGMGDLWSDTLSTVKRMSGSVDPYLPEALCHVDQIMALRKNRGFLSSVFGKPPTVQVPVCPQIPPGQPGIGAEQVLRPLRAAAYVYEHPTIAALGVVAVFAVPFIAGFFVGNRSR